MKKIIAAIVLTIIMTMTFACADDFVASPVLPATGVVEVVAKAANGADGFEIVPIEKTEEDLIVLEDIKEVISEGKPVTEYFGEEAIAAAADAGMIPEGVKVEDYKLKEFERVVGIDYESEYGEVEATFTFATEYPEDAKLLVFVGIRNGGTIQWIPQQAEVVDGKITVHFVQDVLDEMLDNDIYLAILQAD